MILAVPPRVAWLAIGLPIIGVAVSSLAGCQKESEPSSRRAEPEPVVSAEPEPVVSAEPSATHPEKMTQSKAKSVPKTASMSQAEIVKLLLEPKLATWTPDEALEHLAPLGLERTDTMPNSIELVAKLDEGFVSAGYFRHNGPWSFTHVRYQVPKADAKEAEKEYETIASLVRDRVGDPQKVVAKAPYFAQTFQLTPQLSASVGAVTNFDEGRPYAALSIAPVNL